jgi:hypothetical protein
MKSPLNSQSSLRKKQKPKNHTRQLEQNCYFSRNKSSLHESLAQKLTMQQKQNCHFEAEANKLATKLVSA